MFSILASRWERDRWLSQVIMYLGFRWEVVGIGGVTSEEPVGPGMGIPGPNNNRRPESHGGSNDVQGGHSSTKGPQGWVGSHLWGGNLFVAV